MDGIWMLVGLGTWALCFLCAFSLMRVASYRVPRPTPWAATRRHVFGLLDHGRHRAEPSAQRERALQSKNLAIRKTQFFG
jgi:hypothetical protein